MYQFDSFPRTLKTKEEFLDYLRQNSRLPEEEDANSFYISKMAHEIQTGDLFKSGEQHDQWYQFEGFILQDGRSFEVAPSHSVTLSYMSALTLGITMPEYYSLVPKEFWADMHVFDINVTKTLVIYPELQLFVGALTPQQESVLTRLKETYPTKIKINLQKIVDLNLPTAFDINHVGTTRKDWLLKY